MATTANQLANLLPTGTVLAFQALAPPFSNNGGVCHPANKFLTIALIISCSLACFLSSFTDSFHAKNGKLHHGIATFRGLFLFTDHIDHSIGEETDEKEMEKYRISLMDFVHAFASVTVFLVFALGGSDYVHHCLFPELGFNNGHQLVMNLPLGASFVASILFILFPTTRRGIGYTAMAINHPK